MADNKNTITNLEALVASKELAENANKKELAEKLTHMIEVAEKAKNRKSGTKAPSKATLQLENDAREVFKKMQEFGKPVGTTWIVEHMPFVTTSQKATAVMRKAMQLGLVEKGEPVKGKVQYQVVSK